MKKTERYLARLAPHASTLTKGGAAHQIGAICYRVNEMGAVEVLLITTRASGRWTIPKGWPIKNLKPHQAAEREAWEEAGVAGKAKKRALGYFTYLKNSRRRTQNSIDRRGVQAEGGRTAPQVPGARRETDGVAVPGRGRQTCAGAGTERVTAAHAQRTQ
ncbi:NUDIX domain-containing protein (plasmid) [Sinorhizobium meliloti]|nr:NUDIX domain-containing protein [Sinorhizobium meliloti]